MAKTKKKVKGRSKGGLIGAPVVQDWTQAPSLDYFTTTLTIAVGQTQSPELDLRGYTLVGVFFPANAEGANLSFQGSPTSGGTYYNIQDGSGSDVSKAIATGKYIPLDPSIFVGIRFLKVTTDAPQAGADAVIPVVLRQV